MTQAILKKAQAAVLHVIDEKPLTVSDTVDQAHAGRKISEDDLEAAVYMMLHAGRVKLDKNYRLKRVGDCAK